MSGITSHVLDTARGKPAGRVPVALQRCIDGKTFADVAHGETDSDGRIKDFDVAGPWLAGTYRLTFSVSHYFQTQGIEPYFFPEVVVTFVVRDPTQSYHVPLLLSPFGYSTYRGT